MQAIISPPDFFFFFFRVPTDLLVTRDRIRDVHIYLNYTCSQSLGATCRLHKN